jgi:hypothetical protein
MLNRWDIINFFIEKNKYQNYLEIGYYKGWSFDRINCKTKTAVDPEPSKNEQQVLAKRGDIINDEFGVIFKMTSDEFFFSKEVIDGRAGLAQGITELTPRGKYDIIFIDGLHAAHQVLKDFSNAIKNLAEDGVIILHDCNPPKYDHTTTGIDGCWTGDTYKAAIEIQNIYAVDFYTIDTDWGVGVAKREDARKPINRITAKFDGSWSMFNLYRKELLNLIDITTFLSRERAEKVTVLNQ